MVLHAHFIQDIIDQDFASEKYDGRVHTRFPPEPNGYLHIGHAKSICLNFGLAERNHGKCNLRFDDTNPSKEDVEYVDAIMEDVRWLGFDWEDRLFYASDYFEQIYSYAFDLIRQGKAYVCDLTPDQMREYRGTLTTPGKNSPYRDRSIEENLDLFTRMKAGEFSDGSRILRAKIDMSSPNINLRDPALYRILRATHHRTGDRWCIYPMYDFAHPICDALEGITHSICTLEFEDHRPLYDWCIENLDVPCRPQQIEFARLNLNYTVVSKRKLVTLVTSHIVSGWDDPRMPTISGLRRRGYSPSSIREFAETIGISKSNSIVEIQLLEHIIREELNKSAPRAMAVLKPIKLILDNYPEDQVEWFDIENNPEEPAAGIRKIPFCKELLIEEEDFCENPTKGYFRLSPGAEVRLKQTYYVKCLSCVKEGSGRVVEVHGIYDPESRHGTTPDNRKVKGTIHWVSARHSVPAEIRLYDRLFTAASPDEADFLACVNPHSLITLSGQVEPSLAEAKPGDRYQFLRTGYFCSDAKDSREEHLVFNRIVALRDSFKG